jgi:hypothetical protein
MGPRFTVVLPRRHSNEELKIYPRPVAGETDRAAMHRGSIPITQPIFTGDGPSRRHGNAE